MCNPYQSPLPDEFLDDTVQGYEESISAYIRLVNSLRDRVRELEGENERLKWQLVHDPVQVNYHPVVFGCHMEGADID